MKGTIMRFGPLILACLAVSVHAGQPDNKSDLARMAGTWDVVAFEVSGKPQDLEKA